MSQPLAVVTGGTRGIGAAISARLAAAGYTTVALARTLSTTEIDGVEQRVCDISDADAVGELFEQLGPVDVLINNAGISSSNPLGRTTLDEWNMNIAVNATGVFLCTRAVFDSMVSRGRGSIVTVASTASLVGDRYTSAYSASKHAAVGVMRVAAAEAADSGVAVGWVCPTFVRTEMTVATIANIAERTGCSLDEAEVKLARATPHGRIIEIDEVVDAVIAVLDQGHNGTEVLLDGSVPLGATRNNDQPNDESSDV